MALKRIYEPYCTSNKVRTLYNVDFKRLSFSVCKNSVTKMRETR